MLRSPRSLKRLNMGQWCRMDDTGMAHLDRTFPVVHRMAASHEDTRMESVREGRPEAAGGPPTWEGREEMESSWRAMETSVREGSAGACEGPADMETSLRGASQGHEAAEGPFYIGRPRHRHGDVSAGGKPGARGSRGAFSRGRPRQTMETVSAGGQRRARGARGALRTGRPRRHGDVSAGGQPGGSGGAGRTGRTDTGTWQAMGCRGHAAVQHAHKVLHTEPLHDRNAASRNVTWVTQVRYSNH